MTIHALQRFIEPYFRVRNNRVERVKGHLWPSDRYFTDRKVKAWKRRKDRRRRK